MDYYLILFVHLETRRLFITPATQSPTDAWTIQQARNFVMHVEEQGLKVTHLIRDNDGKFSGGGFDEVLKAAGVEPVRIQPLSPNMNAFAERAIQTVQKECLDHFIVLGGKHLDYLVSQFLENYHEERPHQAKGNVPLKAHAAAPPEKLQTDELPLRLREVGCRQRLGGLLKHYYRRAA